MSALALPSDGTSRIEETSDQDTTCNFILVTRVVIQRAFERLCMEALGKGRLVDDRWERRHHLWSQCGHQGSIGISKCLLNRASACKLTMTGICKRLPWGRSRIEVSSDQDTTGMVAKANYVPIDQLPSYVGKKVRRSWRRCCHKVTRRHACTMPCSCHAWVKWEAKLYELRLPTTQMRLFPLFEVVTILIGFLADKT